MNLRDILQDLGDLVEKTASANTQGPTLQPVKDDSNDLEKSAETQKLSESLESGIAGLLEKLAAPEGEKQVAGGFPFNKDDDKKDDDKKDDDKKDANKKDANKKDEGEKDKDKKVEKKANLGTNNHNYSQEDLQMFNKLASTGALQAYTNEQLLDKELSKEAGIQLALETAAQIIENSGGFIEKTASVYNYHAAIDEVNAAGHIQLDGNDEELLKTAADTQIVKSYLDTLVSQGKLTSEGQAIIQNSLAQAADVNEETIAAAVAGLEPEQAAQAQQSLLDQFVQRNTEAVPAGEPHLPASVPAPAVSAGGFTSDSSLAPATAPAKPEVNHGPTTEGTAPVPVQGNVEDYEKKAAAWDQYSPALIDEAAAFEKLAESNPELWAMVQADPEGILSKEAEEGNPLETYYANFLTKKGYGVV